MTDQTDFQNWREQTAHAAMQAEKYKRSLEAQILVVKAIVTVALAAAFVWFLDGVSKFVLSF